MEGSRRSAKKVEVLSEKMESRSSKRTKLMRMEPQAMSTPTPKRKAKALKKGNHFLGCLDWILFVWQKILKAEFRVIYCIYLCTTQKVLWQHCLGCSCIIHKYNILAIFDLIITILLYIALYIFIAESFIFDVFS